MFYHPDQREGNGEVMNSRLWACNARAGEHNSCSAQQLCENGIKFRATADEEERRQGQESWLLCEAFFTPHFIGCFFLPSWGA